MYSSCGDCYLPAGVSEDLNRLVTRRCDLPQDVNSKFEVHQVSCEALKEVELPNSLAVITDNNGKEIAMQNMVRPSGADGEVRVPSGEMELIEAESRKNAAYIDVQEQLESSFDLHHVDRPQNTILRELDKHATLISVVEEKQDDSCTNLHQNSRNGVFEASLDLSDANNNVVSVVDGTSFGNLASADCADGDGVVGNIVVAAVNDDVVPVVNDDSSVQVEDFSDAKAASITVEDMGVDIVNVDNLDINADHLDRSHDDPANVDKDDGHVASGSMLDKFIVEVGKDFPTVGGCADASAESAHDMVLVDCRPVAGDSETMDSGAGKVTEGSGVIVDMEQAVSMVPHQQEPHVDSFPVLPCTESPSAVGENSSLNIEDVESTPMDFAATRESSVSNAHIDSYIGSSSQDLHMTIQISFKYTYKYTDLRKWLCFPLILMYFFGHMMHAAVSLYFISRGTLDIINLFAMSSSS